MQQPATDAELVDALARRRLGLPPPPFTVHDDVLVFHLHPSKLYDKYGGGKATSSDGGIYLFSNQFTCGHHDGWTVAAGTQPILDGGGCEVGWKDTLVFQEGRWLPKTRWAMDEFRAEDQKYSDWMRLYRLRRLEG